MSIARHDISHNTYPQQQPRDLNLKSMMTTSIYQPFLPPSSYPTTSLTFPQVFPHFISPTPIPTPPPTPGPSGPKGVKTIEHSSFTRPPSPSPQRLNIKLDNENKHEQNLARSSSDDSIQSAILITPETQSPLIHNIILRDHSEHRNLLLSSPEADEDHSVSGHTLQKDSSSRRLSSTNNVIPIDAFMEVRHSPHHPHEYLRRISQPQTAFARGEMIHPKFSLLVPQTISNQLDEEEENDDESSSESSGYSSIIPSDQIAERICMYEYWRMYDTRVREEKEERRRVRKFYNGGEEAEAEGKVRDWLFDQYQQRQQQRREDQVNKRPLSIITKRRDTQSNNVRTSSSAYSPLSPEPWLAKPLLDDSLVPTARISSSPKLRMIIGQMDLFKV
ncbi:hypothetical protein I203_101895 [Kwoniella mangroviensis CBS 8507]|uniref:uncharacterized protein n=1 Tax=Kwoniella mangroviensis CBS 8507 TaxID=1296122 RepID=UPI00080CEF64|nr:uncharacterized protein I203_03091 [Kwoniella mangroviensis CBS 8507]OCF67397.1 hypothetical protein I203_03091 [Kwoniella mangroviensis CBS 8507]